MTEIFGYSSYKDCHQLNKNQRDSIYSHKNGISGDVNRYLRGIMPLSTFDRSRRIEIKNHVESIDNVFIKLPSLPDIVLYRGISLKFRNYRPYEVHEEFSDIGYPSTSLSESIAMQFLKPYMISDSKKGQLFVIYNNTDKDGVLIGPWEAEVILPRSTTFRVMSSFELEGNYISLVQRCGESCSELTDNKIKSFWKKFTHKILGL